MSFFERAKPKTVPSIVPPKPTPVSLRGDRMMVFRNIVEKEIEPRKSGLQSKAKVDRVPRGCLFKVGGGFFDLDGYWCVRKAKHVVNVTRGAPKRITATLSDAQKKELRRVRSTAARNGLR